MPIIGVIGVVFSSLCHRSALTTPPYVPVMHSDFNLPACACLVGVKRRHREFGCNTADLPSRRRLNCRMTSSEGDARRPFLLLHGFATHFRWLRLAA